MDSETAIEGRSAPSESPKGGTQVELRNPTGTARRRKAHLLAAVLFVLTLIIYRVPFDPNGTLANAGHETLAVAHSLATNGTFANPFRVMDTGPTAHVAPAFPFLVALLIKVFGDGPAGLFALRLMDVLVYAVQLSLLPLLAARFGIKLWAGFLAGGAYLFGVFIDPSWEANCLGLVLICLAFPMYAGLRSTLSAKSALVAGVLWGVAMLMNPLTVLGFVAWLLMIGFAGHTTMRTRLVLFVPLLIVMPWMIRNFLVFGRPVFVRDNFGLELAVSNSSCTTYTAAIQTPNCPEFDAHPNRSLEEAQRLQRLGEVKYNSQKLHQALGWIRSNPSAFIKLSAHRCFAFWFQGGLIVLVSSILAIPGLWLLWKKNRAAAQLMLLWLVAFPPIYYFVAFGTRYRYPILWATMLPAAYFLSELIGKLASKPQQNVQSENP
jgi:hypothetical protein